MSWNATVCNDNTDVITENDTEMEVETPPLDDSGDEPLRPDNSDDQTPTEDSSGEQITPPENSGVQTAPEDGSGEQITSEDGSGEQITSEDSSGEQITPPENSGVQTAPEDGSGEKITSEDGSGEKITPPENSGAQTASEDSSDAQTHPRDDSDDHTHPEDGTSNRTSPQDNSGSERPAGGDFKGEQVKKQLKRALQIHTTSVPVVKRRRTRRVCNQKKQHTPCKKSKKIDTNVCQQCQQIFQSGDEENWVGCDYCPRWFHVQCVSIDNVQDKWRCPMH